MPQAEKGSPPIEDRLDDNHRTSSTRALAWSTCECRSPSSFTDQTTAPRSSILLLYCLSPRSSRLSKYYYSSSVISPPHKLIPEPTAYPPAHHRHWDRWQTPKSDPRVCFRPTRLPTLPRDAASIEKIRTTASFHIRHQPQLLVTLSAMAVHLNPQGHPNSTKHRS